MTDDVPVQGHVIVCGLHGVGLRVVEQLHLAAVPTVVVDDRPDPRLERAVAAWGVPHLRGDAREPATLVAAGLDGAVALVCVESDDLLTLEIVLHARELRPGLRVVMQLTNPAVGRAVAEVTDEGGVLDVAAIAASSVVEACLRDPAHEVPLGGERFVVAQVRAPWSGTLRSVFGDLAPVAVLPDDGTGPVLCPGRDARVAAGDLVAVLGTPDELDAAGLPWELRERQSRAALVRPGRAWPEGRRPASAPLDLLRFLLGASLRVVAIDRGGTGALEHSPRRGTRLHGGDTAYVGPVRGTAAGAATRHASSDRVNRGGHCAHDDPQDPRRAGRQRLRRLVEKEATCARRNPARIRPPSTPRSCSTCCRWVWPSSPRTVPCCGSTPCCGACSASPPTWTRPSGSTATGG
jgi:Trk K+ transport system NAD-binding subunit